MKKRLITSALPYVNNIPHLGNLIQVLSGDVFARFCRLKGYETLYVCGTDEYGTATETKALIEKKSPKELCDYYNKIHREIYTWFNIEFDYFGRTSDAKQAEIVQMLFKQIDAKGFVKEHELEQLYCDHCRRFLADRYVSGHCPKCGAEDARGDQCDSCGGVLEPTELIDPKCSICGNTPHIKITKHLYIDLPAIRPKLEAWLDEASVRGFWANNAIAITKSWIRDGLRERAITRDIKWGVPVPKPGFEDKVFYVWFDAPIGYISITANNLPNYKEAWWQNPKEVELFQFIGKDNIPFHTVLFPSTLLAADDDWTMLHHMSSTEYLNYENQKFSKSNGIGIFGNDCKDTGISADIWRFYVYYNRPEKGDSQFLWQEFMERVNGELIGNFGNLVNRTLSFVQRFYQGKVPKGSKNSALWQQAEALTTKFMAEMEHVEIKDALRTVLQLSSVGNKAFQDGEPWRTVKEAEAEAASLIFNLVYLVRDIAMLMHIFIPETSEKVLKMLNTPLNWQNLANLTGLDTINEPQLLFKQLDEEEIENLKLRYSGTQEENRIMNEELNKTQNSEAEYVRTFTNSIDLRAAKIIAVERHSDAETLYILQLDLGDGNQRQIISSIVPYYKEEELLNKTIVLVANLKKAKFRGTVSHGMLIAAEAEGDDDDSCELIFTEAAPGSRFIPVGMTEERAKNNISSERFYSFPMRTVDGVVLFEGKPLESNGIILKAYKYINNEIG